MDKLKHIKTVGWCRVGAPFKSIGYRFSTARVSMRGNTRETSCGDRLLTIKRATHSLDFFIYRRHLTGVGAKTRGLLIASDAALTFFPQKPAVNFIGFSSDQRIRV